MNQQPKTLASQWLRIFYVLVWCILIGFLLKNVGGSSGWIAVFYGLMAFFSAVSLFFEIRLVLLRVCR